MGETTISSRDFNQGVSAATRAADQGPVIIAKRGKPAYVLLTFDAYRKLAGKDRTLAELLYMPGIADIGLAIPPRDDFARATDFS